MNEVPDPLESELAGLYPAPPTQRLRQGIAEQLDPTCSSTIPPSWKLIVAATVLAACILAAVLLHSTNQAPQHGIVDQPESPVLEQQRVRGPFDRALPTLWAYHTALHQSSQDLDDLLRKHSGLVLAQGPEARQVTAFDRFDFDFPQLPGDF
jgi:hypothetical protein